MIRCLIADDAAAFRAVMRIILAEAPGVEVVGEAASGREVVELACKLRPDVILMDMVMPEMDGKEFLVRALDESPERAPSFIDEVIAFQA